MNEVVTGAAVAIVGPARSGKTAELRERAERFAREHPELGVMRLDHPAHVTSFALELLAGAGRRIALIDDPEAEALFAALAGPLFALEWSEFEAGTIDPEVPGLRSPDRFLTSAFRLIRKLRDAAITPEVFLERSLAGATQFYAKPPNFAHPQLIQGTKDAYRDSLDVDSAELQRQYRREVDLAKVLARLYRQWIDAANAAERMTGRDAIAEAIAHARLQPDLAKEFFERYPAAFLDDAQEATLGVRLFLETIYGEDLRGVTLAGDPKGATGTFRGARPDAMFKDAGERIELRSERPPVAATAIRCTNERDEADLIAKHVAEHLHTGTPPAQIAILFRSVCDVASYERTLLERGIPVAQGGDFNIFADARALDALALLWNAWDPFRHDWMIRTLRGGALALSDASVAKLCAEPPDAQTALFAFDNEPAPTERASRWDLKRDLRLGWNVVRGEADTGLSEVALERVRRFRSLREGWVAAMASLPFAAFARKVWSEGLAREGEAGSAATLAQELVLQRLLVRLEAFASHPHWTLGDVLEEAERRAESELEWCEPAQDERFVQLLSVDAARGRSFDVVVIPDARAGSFPRWYVPDSFLFSPALGMIPKDNVGDARASRTAKFSYYLHRTKARDAYNEEERRAFRYAMSRARTSLLVTASGRPTRGMTAPEFLEELRRSK